MHGQGVNIRHIGLLRYNLLEIAAQAQLNAYIQSSASSSSPFSSSPTDHSVVEEEIGIDSSPLNPNTEPPTTKSSNNSVIANISIALDPSIFALQAHLFQVALSRCLKSLIRERQREFMRTQKTSSEIAIRRYN